MAVDKKLDSLADILSTSHPDTIKVDAMNELFRILSYDDPSRALDYAKKANELACKSNFGSGTAKSLNNIGLAYSILGNQSFALVYYLKAVNFCEKNGFGRIKSIALANIGNLYYAQRNLPKTIEYFEKSLVASKEVNDIEREALLLANLGVVYYEQESFVKALEYYQQSLKHSEMLGNKRDIANTLNQIGIIYDIQANYDQALIYYNQALSIRREINDQEGTANSLINMGIIYFMQKDYPQAEKHYHSALMIAREINHKSYIALILSKLGWCSSEQGKNSEALGYYDKALEIYESIDDNYGMAMSWNSMGNLYFDVLNYQKAIEYFQKSIAEAEKNNYYDIQKTNYNDLASSFAKIGNFQEAYYYKEKYSRLNDSIYSVENARNITDMQVKYETEKKENEIHMLTRDMEVNELKLQKNRTVTFSLLIGFIFVIILSFVIYNRFRLKKKANRLLQIQKDEIELQQLEITDSIRYAWRIQSAILPLEDKFQELLSDYFLLYMPKDIVSGDFYWVTKKNNEIVFCVADCTGHGVPGAFMSMLGMAFLAEIVNNSNNTEPNEILNLLRMSVITSLRQTGKSGESQDGMDMALCVLNKSDNSLKYAGANNSIYVVCQGTYVDQIVEQAKGRGIAHLEGATSALIEIKSDRMPIGIHRKADKPFCTVQIFLPQGTVIYLFSDGYADQFGGTKEPERAVETNGEKFKYRQFRELIFQHANQPLTEQKEKIYTRFLEWKADQHQIDDVILMGVKISDGYK